MSVNSKKPRVLVVEDNPVDVQILQHAFSTAEVALEIDVADDGESAMDLLQKQSQSAQTPLPGLVILDLNLPKMSGLEVLREMRNNQRLKRIPVVVMSSSRSERDVNSAYDSGANLYVRKPNDLDNVERLIQAIVQVWLYYGVLPVNANSSY